MAVVIMAAVGTLMFIVSMYACLVAGSRMDDQLEDLQRRKERKDGTDGENEKE